MLIVGPPGTAKSALDPPPRPADRRPLLRVPADPLLGAERDLRAGRHQGLPGGDVRAARRDDAAGRGHRLPGRDLQVELGNLEWAAQHPERAPLLHGQQQRPGPAVSLYGATNEIPNDDALGAVFDRFLVRALSENLDSFHFHGLVERGLCGSGRRWSAPTGADGERPLVSLRRHPHACSCGCRGSWIFPRTSWPATRGWSSRSVQRG